MASTRLSCTEAGLKEAWRRYSTPIVMTATGEKTGIWAQRKIKIPIACSAKAITEHDRSGMRISRA